MPRRYERNGDTERQRRLKMKRKPPNGGGMMTLRRKWADVLQCQMTWWGSIDQEVCRWCIIPWNEIQKIYQKIGDCSNLGKELYIKTMIFE